MVRKKMLLAAGFMIGTAVAPSSAFANYWGTCCGDTVRWFHDATFKVLPISFPAGGTARARFENAVAQYNAITGSWFDWTVIEDNDNTLTHGGDGNEVGIFGNAPDWGVLGQARVTWGVCGWPACDEEISETDIYFYLNDKDGTPYNMSYSSPAGSYFMRPGVSEPGGQQLYDGAAAGPWPLYLAVVASHEIGHATGLDHTSVVIANGGVTRMGALYPNGGWTHVGGDQVSPFPYDCGLVRDLYPTSGTSADVYALSFETRGTGSGGGIQDNFWPATASLNYSGDKMKYPFNVTADRLPTADDRVVFPGDMVRVNACWGNYGNASASGISVEFYLSTNQTINTNDIRSSTTYTASFGPESSWCTELDFQVPTGVARNQWYYIAIWLNRGSSTSATTDNVTILNRRIRVGNYP